MDSPSGIEDSRRSSRTRRAAYAPRRRLASPPMRAASLLAARGVLVAGPVAIAFFAGGFFDGPRLVGLAVVAVVLAVLALAGAPLPAHPAARAALAAALAYAGWIALSATWAPVTRYAISDAERALLYAAVLAAAALAFSTRAAVRALEPLAAAGTVDRRRLRRRRPAAAGPGRRAPAAERRRAPGPAADLLERHRRARRARAWCCARAWRATPSARRALRAAAARGRRPAGHRLLPELLARRAGRAGRGPDRRRAPGPHPAAAARRRRRAGRRCARRARGGPQPGRPRARGLDGHARARGRDRARHHASC